MWTVRTTLAAAEELLARRGIDEAKLDAEILLAHALSVRRIDLYTSRDRPLDDAERARFRELVKVRAARVPTAHIVGEREFYSIPLHVTRDVLVPRPETELLVDVALDEIARRAAAGLAPGRVADIGTGSGAIAIAVAKLGAARVASVIATDASEAALGVATRNVARHGLGEKIALARGDLLAPARAKGPFDILLSNPPYIPVGERERLAPEVLSEPHMALFSGKDGLDAVRAIVAGAADVLAPGGLIALEIGAGQASAAMEILRASGLVDVRAKKDLAGIERVVLARRASS